MLHTAPILFAIGCLILMTGCSWFEPKKRTQGILNAQVNPWFGARVTIRVQAYRRDKKGKREVVSTHEAPSDGTVSFVLPMKGTYGLLAYADLNRNGRADPGEPRASAENLVPLSPYGTGPQYTPVPLRLPGKGVRRPTTETRPAVRVFTAEDERRLNFLREHLPAGIRLPDSLPLPLQP